MMISLDKGCFHAKLVRKLHYKTLDFLKCYSFYRQILHSLFFIIRRHFIDEQALDKHIRSKAHKKRLRELKEPAYTHAEAEAAGGLGNFIPPKRRKTSNMEVS